jgi:hypothetical protein
MPCEIVTTGRVSFAAAALLPTAQKEIAIISARHGIVFGIGLPTTVGLAKVFPGVPKAVKACWRLK